MLLDLLPTDGAQLVIEKLRQPMVTVTCAVRKPVSLEPWGVTLASSSSSDCLSYITVHGSAWTGDLRLIVVDAQSSEIAEDLNRVAKTKAWVPLTVR